MVIIKIKVLKNFRYEGKEYGEGDVIELPDSVAKSVMNKGYGEKAGEEAPEVSQEDASEEEIEEFESKKGPEWKRKIWISEDRNIAISIWPKGGKFDSPSVTMEESRRDDSGNWQSNRIYLPTGNSLIALSEHIKSAWNEMQKIKSEK